MLFPRSLDERQNPVLGNHSCRVLQHLCRSLHMAHNIELFWVIIFSILIFSKSLKMLLPLFGPSGCKQAMCMHQVWHGTGRWGMQTCGVSKGRKIFKRIAERDLSHCTPLKCARCARGGLFRMLFKLTSANEQTLKLKKENNPKCCCRPHQSLATNSFAQKGTAAGESWKCNSHRQG